MQWWIWLAAGGLLLVVEMLTVDLLFASLAFSALIAAGVSFLTPSAPVQGIVFAIAAVISIFLLRPIALKNLKKSSPDIATNIEALIGASAITISEVDENGGQVKLNGEIWSARSSTGRIKKTTQTKVVAIEGATAVVTEERDK